MLQNETDVSSHHKSPFVFLISQIKLKTMSTESTTQSNLVTIGSFFVIPTLLSIIFSSLLTILVFQEGVEAFPLSLHSPYSMASLSRHRYFDDTVPFDGQRRSSFSPFLSIVSNPSFYPLMSSSSMCLSSQKRQDRVLRMCEEGGGVQRDEDKERGSSDEETSRKRKRDKVMDFLRRVGRVGKMVSSSSSSIGVDEGPAGSSSTLRQKESFSPVEKKYPPSTP